MSSAGAQSSKPVLAEGQKDAAGRILQQIILPSVFGGAPDAATEASINRAQQLYSTQMANQGIDPQSGVYQRGQVDVARGGIYARANQKFDWINRVFAPIGSQSSGGTGPLGFSGFGGSGFGS